MSRKRRTTPPMLLAILALPLPLLLVACGGNDAEVNVRGGAPKLPSAASGKAKTARAEKPQTAAAEQAAPEKRAKSEPLTRENFGPDMRDPFRSFLVDETIQAGDEEPVIAERQREVQMPSYNFEDLTLVGIIGSKRGIEPRALFIATDGISGTIQQGQYFSRAEVLLSSVNTGYVEIEIVDENLAKGLNLTNGETRAIYLKRE